MLDAFGDRPLVARAGLILGPYERVGRLPWWLRRLERGGDVADTWRWLQAEGDPASLWDGSVGLDPAREADVLTALD